MDIYVGNLAWEATDQDLEDLFAAHGKVASARVITDRESGRSRGFGFVTMPDGTEAEAAVAATHGSDFMGRQLKVNEAQPKPQGQGQHRDRRDSRRAPRW